MNNIIVSFVIMFITIVCGYTIGTFFDISLTYYLPFLLWIIALCIFNLFLDKEHVNIYLKDIKETKKDSYAAKAMEAIRSTITTRFTKSNEAKVVTPEAIAQFN